MPPDPTKRDPGPPKYTGQLTEFEAHLAAALRQGGIAEADSHRLGHRVMQSLARTCGGRSVYIPRNAHAITAARDAAILDSYDGTTESINRLAQEHGVTTIALYRMIARERARRLAALPH